MIAWAVEVFERNRSGRVELRRIMDQSGPTLRTFVKDAAAPGKWTATDGWAGCDGLENHMPVAVEDTPAHEILDWFHRAFSNLNRWSGGVLHGFQCKRPDWQLVELSFRWSLRRRRGESLFLLIESGLSSGPATWKYAAAEA